MVVTVNSVYEINAGIIDSDHLYCTVPVLYIQYCMYCTVVAVVAAWPLPVFHVIKLHGRYCNYRTSFRVG